MAEKMANKNLKSWKVSPGIHKEARLEAAERGVDIQEIVEEAWGHHKMWLLGSGSTNTSKVGEIPNTKRDIKYDDGNIGFPDSCV